MTVNGNQPPGGPSPLRRGDYQAAQVAFAILLALHQSLRSQHCASGVAGAGSEAPGGLLSALRWLRSASLVEATNKLLIKRGGFHQPKPWHPSRSSHHKMGRPLAFSVVCFRIKLATAGSQSEIAKNGGKTQGRSWHLWFSGTIDRGLMAAPRPATPHSFPIPSSYHRVDPRRARDALADAAWPTSGGCTCRWYAVGSGRNATQNQWAPNDKWI